MFRQISLLVLVCSLSGCVSYVTPGRGANLADVGAPRAADMEPGADVKIRESFDKKPLAHFPANLAVARIQAAGYHSNTSEGWGTGKFTLVTVRDIESPDAIDRISKLPQLGGVAPINRMLFQTDKLDTDLPLRQAAASLHADLLLIYTLDTTFSSQDKAVPLSVLTLGLSPNQAIRVNSTASAILLDTRNGYVYGLAEATAKQDRLTSGWQESDTVDATRKQTEAEAFDKLVSEFGSTWNKVVRTYGPTTQPNVQ